MSNCDNCTNNLKVRDWLLLAQERTYRQLQEQRRAFEIKD